MHELIRLILDSLPKATRRIAPVNWFGGKGLLARKLLPLIPRGKVYVEPYGGGASLLFNRDPVNVEVYNDLDEDLVNLFRALQNPLRFRWLLHRLTWTLYSRKEYERAVRTLQNPHATPNARAWALFVAQNQGIGGMTKRDLKSWGRVITPTKQQCQVTRKLRVKMGTLRWWHERLTRVQIECRNALHVIERWDSRDTVLYIDPPYVPSTRKDLKYKYEASDKHHCKLLELILTVKGAVIISGYDNALYKPLTEAGWEKNNFKTHCFASAMHRGKDGKPQKRSSRTETVWRNQRAIEMCREEAQGREKVRKEKVLQVQSQTTQKRQGKNTKNY